MSSLATIAALLLAALGLAILFRALFADRSCGRRRCPKCWYDMAGVPTLTCPECGHAAKAERALHRTRRRWRSVLAAAAVFTAMWTALVSGRIAREGWIGLVPTPALAATVLTLRTGGSSSTSGLALVFPQPGPPASSNWRSAVCDSATNALQTRLTAKEVWSPVRRAIHELAWRRIDRDLDRYPPVVDSNLHSILYATSTNNSPQRDPSIAGLVAPCFKLHNPAIEGSPVYATLEAAGLGDLDARMEIRTDWLDQNWVVESVRTPEAKFTWLMIANPGFTDDTLISLGRATAGGTVVRVTVRIWRLWPSQPPDHAPARVRHYHVPIDVRPRAEDPLVPVTVSQEQFRSHVVSARIEDRSYGPARLYFDYHQFHDVVLGARVRVLDDRGALCYEGEVPAPVVSAPMGGLRRLSLQEVDLRTPGNTPFTPGPPTRVIFKCDPDLARMVPNCVRCFDGEYEIPLTDR